MRHLLGTAFFFSGAAALVLQTMWTRRLTTLLGNTTEAAALVLAIFFAGIAVGNAIASAILPRVRRPLLAYALCEALVAAAVPVAWAAGPAWLSSLGAFGVAAAIVGPATIAMGATLPFLCAHLGGSWRPTTWLYALNTAGAMVGALLGGVFLPPAIGLRGTEIAAMGALGAIAAVVGALGLRTTSAFEPPKPAERRWGPIAAAFVSGFGLIALEVLWTRKFTLIFHNSVYTFALIVAVVIGALALGAALCNVAVDRLGARRVIGIGLSLAAVGTVVGCVVFSEGAGLDRFGGDRPFVAYLWAATGLVALTAGPTAVAAGLVFPALWRWARGDAEGRTLAGLAAANTMGVVAGALGTTFVLIPKAGMWTSFVAVAGLYALAALAFTPRLAVGALLVASGLVAVRDVTSYPVQDLRRGEQVLHLRETASGTVAVIQNGETRLVMDNLYTLGGTRAKDRQRREGFIPTMLHPDPRRVACIGVGTGIALGGTLTSTGVERVLAIELVGGVMEAARMHFAPFNNYALHDPRVEAVVADGRAHLAQSGERFDVVISDLFVPWHAGAGHLYTRDHFLSVRERLDSDGLFALWLPVWQLGERDFETIAATFVSVFPACEAWRASFNPVGPVVALIGWAGRPAYTDALLAARLLPADPHFVDLESATMLRIGELDADDFAHAPLNTIDRPVIEFSAPRSDRAKDRLTGARWHAIVERLIADDAAEGPWARRARAGERLHHALVLATHPTSPDLEAAQALIERTRDGHPAGFLDDVLRRGPNAVGP